MRLEYWARFLGFVGALVVTGVVVWLFFFYRSDKISTVYGKRRGPHARSVNGTAAFGAMFEAAGARVRNAYRLSRGLSRSQVIVWTPDSFELPSSEEIDFFEEDWLSINDGVSRTLIYVARNYEAAIEYWRLQADRGEATPHIESTRQLARTQSDHAYKRSLTGVESKCDWFSIDEGQKVLSVKPTQGPWAPRIDADHLDLLIAGVLRPQEFDERDFRKSRVMLGAEETPLILEITDEYQWPGGRVLVLLNGSSILNYPLVHHENRKLAGQIIDYCDSPKRVTFLESGPAGLFVSRSGGKTYSGFEALTVWPMNVILLHLIAAGMLFCVMVFPIFGRPREIAPDSPSNFGKHVQAIQRLLEIANNRELAIERVNQYRQLEGDTTTKPQSKTETGNPFKVSQA